MGDVQRIQTLSNRVNRINILLFLITRKKLQLQKDIQTVSNEDLFCEIFQELGEIDQTIWDLKIEKQR